MSTAFAFTLAGTMPLLIHADNIEAGDELKAWRDDPEHKKSSVKGDDRSPPWTWMTYLYHDGQHLCMPSENIMAAIRKVAAMIPMSGKKTYKEISQSGLLIFDEYCAFAGPKGRVAMADIERLRPLDFAAQAAKVQALGFKLFCKRARISDTAKHVRTRPRFESWSVSGSIEIVDAAISPAVLAQMFDLAGRYSGLGDWRPSAKKSPGPFGTFTAKLEAIH